MYDPLLGDKPNYNNIAQLEEQQKQIESRLMQLKQVNLSSQQPQQRATPVWDEIDNIVAGLSDNELQYLNSNAEYQESSAAVQAILQREYLRIMRPIVEATKDGKDALDKHLTLVKRLRKSARDEANKRYTLMDDYLANYSHMSYNDYIKMRNNGNNTR